MFDESCSLDIEQSQQSHAMFHESCSLYIKQSQQFHAMFHNSCSLDVKHNFIFAFLLYDGARLVLCVWVISQFWRADRHWTLLQCQLEVVEHC